MLVIPAIDLMDGKVVRLSRGDFAARTIYSDHPAEFALAFLLWVRPARPYAIAAGMLLHVGIMLTVNIPIFVPGEKAMTA